ncbi:MAG: hypothetical protein J0G30_02455 [Actinomycetales bacterium]|nr:hypothetical protein [Actinomycetales bacterium]
MAGHSREARTPSPISWDGIYRRKGEAGVSWFQDSPVSAALENWTVAALEK